MERQDERRESIARVHVVAKGEGVRVGDVRGHFFQGGRMDCVDELERNTRHD